jgi:hypothetical protein
LQGKKTFLISSLKESRTKGFEALKKHLDLLREEEQEEIKLKDLNPGSIGSTSNIEDLRSDEVEDLYESVSTL